MAICNTSDALQSLTVLGRIPTCTNVFRISSLFTRLATLLKVYSRSMLGFNKTCVIHVKKCNIITTL